MQQGQILRTRYQIIKFLGSGGFRETHLAQYLDLPGNPKCVVKHLKLKSYLKEKQKHYINSSNVIPFC